MKGCAKMAEIPKSRRENLIQFVKYAIVGGIATAVNVVTFYIMAFTAFPALTGNDQMVLLLSRFADIHVAEVTDAVRSVNAIYCNTAAFLTSNFVCYALNRMLVFAPGRHCIFVEAALFLMVSAVSFFVGTAGQTALIALLGVSTTIALAANIVAALAINYAMRKFVIFRG